MNKNNNFEEVAYNKLADPANSPVGWGELSSNEGSS